MDVTTRLSGPAVRLHLTSSHRTGGGVAAEDGVKTVNSEQAHHSAWANIVATLAVVCALTTLYLPLLVR